MPAPTIAYSSFETLVKDRVFPMGPPDNLVTQISQMVVEAMIYIQRYVECYQTRNVDTKTLVSGVTNSCGASIIEKPRGEILRIRNIVTADACEKFTYNLATRTEVEEIAYKTKDIDETCGLNWGVYCVNHGSISLAPALQTDRHIELDWRGIKRSYAGGDLVPDEPEFLKAVCSYVAKEFARTYDKDTEAFRLESDNFNNSIGELSVDCREHGEDGTT